MIEGEATVSVLSRGRSHPLPAGQRNMQPIYVRKADFRSVDIIGIVVGVYRSL